MTMISGCSISLAVLLSVGLLFGTPAARAGDPGSANTQADKHRKPVAKSASGTTTNAPNGASQAKSKNASGYAKTGNCSGCKPTRLPYDPGKVKPIRNTNVPPAAKLPKGWATPDNCKYVRNDDRDASGHSLWEAEKAACNRAGYPTPWSDKENSSTPAPTPTPDDRSVGERIRDAVHSGVQSEYDKAHGTQPTPCPGDSSLEQDAMSGCHE